MCSPCLSMSAPASSHAAPSPDDARDVFRARAAVHLVLGAVYEPLERHAALDVEHAHSLRRVELVAGDGQQVDAELVHVHRDLPDRLGGVRVDDRTPRRRGTSRSPRPVAASPVSLLACMIVTSVVSGPTAAAIVLHRTARLRPRRRVGHPPSMPLQPAAGFGDGGMLDRRTSRRDAPRSGDASSRLGSPGCWTRVPPDVKTTSSIAPPSKPATRSARLLHRLLGRVPNA